jgi:Xaa-Pro aminopeptidase
VIAPDRVERIQEALREENLAGWLLFDFHGTNPIARAVLGMAEGPAAPKTTRRWFYLVPARGTPRKIVHRLEPRSLDHLPGETHVYLTWQELERSVAEALGRLRDAADVGTPGAGRATADAGDPAIAMEYSPLARLPYVSRVDAGTIDLVRQSGVRLVSSADLAQRFGGALEPAARADHRRTGALLMGIIQGAFRRAREAAHSRQAMTETALQKWILEQLHGAGLVASDPPTVAVDVHSGDPHFTTTVGHDLPIAKGAFLLIDAWAKANRPGAVYADYTQVAFLGTAAPERHRAVFDAVRDARDAAIERVRDGLRSGRPIRGCDVDDAARDVIRSRGHAERFVHRTGHSIGEEVHANGVHLDNLETRDERRLIEGTLVSVEPGIYLDEFGVRTEVNLLIDGGEAVVTSDPIQREILALLP